MIIQKGNKIYTISEYTEKWTVSTDNDKLSVSYDVPKKVCKTFDELNEYILNNDLF